MGAWLLTSCELGGQSTTPDLLSLARWVPGDAERIFFLDLKPEGEMGRHWVRIREQFEANSAGQEVVRGLLSDEFRIEEYGLDEALAGPARRPAAHRPDVGLLKRRS